MFNKTNGPSQTSGQTKTPAAVSTSKTVQAGGVPSILARDLAITGDIKTDGDVQIDGRLDGNIVAGNVTIGEQGAVNGKIIAQNVHIRGKVTGKVESAIVELAETANVQADLVQDQLMIANGAFFDGKCARKSAVKSATPLSAAKKSA